MPKRSREDSTSPHPSTATSPSETHPSPPASIDAPTHSSKYLQVSDHPSQAVTVMKCSLLPHQDTLTFESFEDFEIHYQKVHTNRCSDCRRNFPTEHFLGLHIGENHNPLDEARRAKGEKTYQCFVEDCDKICSTPQKRRMHLTDKHLFPKNYDFLIVNTGIDKRSSMLRTRHHRKSSAASRALYREKHSDTFLNNTPIRSTHDIPMPSTTSSAMTTPVRARNDGKPLDSQSPPNADMDELSSTMSALKFVPPSVRFGRGGRRGGLSRS